MGAVTWPDRAQPPRPERAALPPPGGAGRGPQQLPGLADDGAHDYRPEPIRDESTGRRAVAGGIGYGCFSDVDVRRVEEGIQQRAVGFRCVDAAHDDVAAVQQIRDHAGRCVPSRDDAAAVVAVRVVEIDPTREDVLPGGALSQRATAARAAVLEAANVRCGDQPGARHLRGWEQPAVDVAPHLLDARHPARRWLRLVS